MADETFRVSDRMPEHRKVEAAGGDASWLWVCAMAYCHRNKTDGIISAGRILKVSDRRNPERLIKILIRERMLHESGHDCASCVQPLRGNYVIHDYVDWQRGTIAEREAREAKAAGGSLGNHQRWHLSRGIIDPECQWCVASATSNGSHDRSHMRSLTDPSSDSVSDAEASRTSESLQNAAEIDRGLFPEITPPIVPPTASENRRSDRITDPASGHGKTKGRTRRQDYNYADDVDFLRFWQVFPVKSGKPAAHKAWLAALARGGDPERIIMAAKRYADDPRRDPKHTKYPQGWLNDERYNDDPGTENSVNDYDWEQ